MNWLGIAFLVPLFVNGQSITGKLVDYRTQSAVRNVRVELLPVGADGVTKSTRADSKGTFRLSPVELGEYVVIAGGDGSIRRVLVAHVLNEKEVDLGTLKIRESSCDSPGIYCDYFFSPRPPRPPAPVVDVCEALKSPDRYGNTLIVMVGMLTAINGLPSLTATCTSALASGGLTWPNAVLLPWQADPQDSPTLPDVPDLRKNLADRAAAVRQTSGSATSRIVAVYGFLDIPDGLTAVPCTGDSCTRPDIRMPPASVLRVDAFQELK